MTSEASSVGSVGELVCPLCRGPLAAAGATLDCAPCGERFPVRASRPSFVTPGVLRTAAARCGGEAALARWHRARRATEAWRLASASGAPARGVGLRDRASTPRPVLERLLSLPGVARRGRVLDAGCGTGARAGWFGASRYVGLDPSAQWVRPSLPFVEGIVERLPWAARTFDVALCVDVFDHLIDPDLALSELLRVLAPGGRLFVSVADADAPAEVRHEHQRMFGIREATAHVHRFTAGFFACRLRQRVERSEVVRGSGMLFVEAAMPPR